jgi:hypothetical protein
LLDLGIRMLSVLCAEVPDSTEVVAVESAFAVPLVDQATGAVLIGPLQLLQDSSNSLQFSRRKYRMTLIPRFASLAFL